MARPRKAEQDRRNKLFQVRLLIDERKKIIDAAMAKGLDASAWSRMTLLEQARKESKTNG